MPMVKTPEHQPMSSDSKQMEYGVLKPFDHITLEELPIETKPEIEESRCNMVIPKAGTLKNEVAEDEAPCLWNQTLDTTDTLIIGEEPAMRQSFYPLTLF